jgi:hypothetical protein
MGEAMKLLHVGRASAVTVAAAALLALGGVAFALVEPSYQYSTAQTGYLSLSPMAFSPEDKADADHYTIQGPFSISNDGGAISVCMVAGVNLPDGARIKSLTAWASSDKDQGVQVRIDRINLATGTPANAIGAISHDTSQTRVAMTTAASGSFAIVNNQHFGYGAEVCLKTTSVFYAARITYTYTKAGD